MILKYLLENEVKNIPETFMEFGAWDGKHKLNSSFLIKMGWEGLLVESDKVRFKDLEKNYINAEKISTINAFIEPTGERSIESLWKKTTSEDLGIISIDIDGDDIHLVKNFSDFRPAIVCIEYNPGIPSGLIYENPIGRNIGSSASAIFSVLKTKNYYLRKQGDDLNLYFVHENFLKEEYKKDTKIQNKNTYFFGFDGTLIKTLNGKVIDSKEVYRIGYKNGFIKQPVPKFLRKFYKMPNTLLLIQLIEFLIFRPITAIKLLFGKRS